MKCHVCFHHCDLEPGQTGFCRGRINTGGKIVPGNYGLLTSIALDPIEKKPLSRFYPGKKILSLGSYGCNLKCPFCQNHDISQKGRDDFKRDIIKILPEKIVTIAEGEIPNGNIGVAFTYNEALIGYEFVRDTAKLVHEAGMKNVLVSNGTATLEVLREILPYIDAMNIDLKSFSEDVYRDILKGDLHQTKEFIREASAKCHMEITTLIVPGMNDSEEEIREMTGWISSLNDGKGSEIPYHISRFFPQYEYSDREPTEVKKILRLAGVAGENLKYVYPGNI